MVVPLFHLSHPVQPHARKTNKPPNIICNTAESKHLVLLFCQICLRDLASTGRKLERLKITMKREAGVVRECLIVLTTYQILKELAKEMTESLKYKSAQAE